MQSIQNLLNEVGVKVKALETAKQLYGQQLAPNFNIFNYIASNETNLSYILADLLNPQGSHGQKDLFLQEFIEICLPNLAKNTIWQSYLSLLAQTSVMTEQTTTASNKQRRMDIYLALGDKEKYGICIENKPYAGDQKNQMLDYEIEMRKRHRDNFHLVYLSENGEPTDWSVPSETLENWRAKQLISFVTYTQLAEWLTHCKSNCQNQSVVEFINQFIKFIQKQFMGVEDMNEENAIIESLMQNPANLDLAMRISNAVPQMKARLIQQLTNQLEQKFKEKHYTPRYLKMGSHCYSGFALSFPEHGIEIYFEFQKANYGDLCMGYGLIDQQYQKGAQKFDDIAQKLKEALPNKNLKTSKTWLGWYTPKYNNWQNDAKVWQKIQDGSLVNEIMDEIEELQKAFQTNGIKA